MFHFTTGDLLQSDAQALVNTVNCEGYMGKGLAYQFKKKYPEMNAEYVQQCKDHMLTPGQLHCFYTGKTWIINFPTKNKWKEKSRMEYIHSGLDALIQVIQEHHISSVAIPPLGSGNGGLIWSEVKQIIIQKLTPISSTVDILIYEPSSSGKSGTEQEPLLSLSALLLMKIKYHLDRKHFNVSGLQQTAYLMNILSNKEYFRFQESPYGPYSKEIELISRKICAFQKYYGVKNTEEAYTILLNKLISHSVQEQLNLYIPFIEQASALINQTESSNEMMQYGMVLFFLQQHGHGTSEQIIRYIKNWEPQNQIQDNAVMKILNILETQNIIYADDSGYRIVHR